MEGRGGGRLGRCGGGRSGGASNTPLATTFVPWLDNVMMDLLEKYEEL